MNDRKGTTNEEHAERMRDLQSKQREAVREREIERGVLLVHTGDGKGKSTAGFGVALRAVGAGQHVAIVQFIKGAWRTGEQDAIRAIPEITHVVSGDGFTWDTQDREKDIASAERGWSIARSLIADGEHDVVVLDELCVALSYEYLDTDEVVGELLRRPEKVSVVVTGRRAPAALIEAADTVTEHVAVKHAYAAGIKARRGIEF
ncbi:MAG: cob(I)yrinic acid a,c-diamide adenosyltransferase [Planctomycetota bacterium]